MISFYIFLTALLVAVAMFAVEKNKFGTPNKYGDKEFKPRSLLVPVICFVTGIILSLVNPYSLERVDSGYKGIKVKLTGSDRGVSDYTYQTGWVMYNSWIEQMLEFPTYQQHIEYDDLSVITKGGFSATIKPSFNYSLKSTKIGDMFVNLRLSIKEVEQGWLKNAITSSVNDVANKWEVDSIFNHRELFESAIITECNKRIERWFTVSQLRTNIVPPPALQEAIEGKTRSIQDAQAEDEKAKSAEATARKKIAIAKGDSAEIVIMANARAEKIKIEQRQLTPLYIEYLKAKNWNGVLPTTVAGGTGTFLNIK